MVAKLPVEEILVLREESHAPLSMKKRKYVIVFDSKIADMPLHFAIHHEPCFTCSLDHRFFGASRRQRAERSHQSHLRHTEVLPIGIVIHGNAQLDR